MTSTRPYLLRALYEWLIDNNMTPHILVDAVRDKVEVPLQFIVEDKITLNINPGAVRNLEIGNEYLSFSARFSGKVENILVPVTAVLAIYAQENGEGMVFTEEAVSEPNDASANRPVMDTPEPDKKPNLTIVK
ncbi:MAG: ClpXP protease specificity-enhancing factor [Gammaproteobacteria bacterium]|nr:ClpXP protease specificity-enhancing factor [Gammaproteobacteria bacterium]